MKPQKGVFPTREERVPYRGNTNSGSHSDHGNASAAKTSHTTKRKNRTTRKMSPQKQKKAALAVCAAVIVLILFLLLRKDGAAVYLDGTLQGVLHNPSITAEKIIERLETELSTSVGSEVQLVEEITVEPVRIGSKYKNDVCTEEYLYPKLRNQLTYLVNAAVIQVEAEDVAALISEESANTVLDQLKAIYTPADVDPEDLEVTFVENVSVTPKFVDGSTILSEEDALAALQQTTETTTTYTAVSGDSFYSIAVKYDMSLEELLELNNLTINDSLKAGQVLNVITQKPRISVRTVETTVLTDIEPKTYEYQYDDSQPSSYQKVIQQGKAGQKESTIQTIRINGIVTEEKEVSYQVTVEPVTEIIVKGTQ